MTKARENIAYAGEAHGMADIAASVNGRLDEALEICARYCEQARAASPQTGRQ